MHLNADITCNKLSSFKEKNETRKSPTISKEFVLTETCLLL